MTRMQNCRRSICAALIAVLALVQMPAGLAAAAEGGPIATQDTVEAEGPSAAEKRATVTDFLERDDVAQELEDRGVDPAEAKARVAGLSDAEVERLYNKVENVPAGGLLGEIIGAAVTIFVVLVITDILGFTNVFPFTSSIND